MVVLHHGLLSLPSGASLAAAFEWVPGLAILGLGRPAVVLFFVLSGFVLAPSVAPGPQGFVRFATKRAVRLLPPYWAAIAAAFLLLSLAPARPAAGLSPWFHEQWRADTSVTDLFRHLAMLAGPNQYPIDQVAWSLVHEVRLSLILPVLVLVAARCGLAACLATAAAVSVGAELFVGLHPGRFPTGVFGLLFDLPSLGDSLVLTARFAIDFAVGLALAQHRSVIAAVFARRAWLLPITAVAGLVLLCARHELVLAAGAALLIAAVARSVGLARALDAAALSWLGRVSYSLYLVHLPILLACGLWLDGVLPAPARLCLAIVLALVAAQVLWRLVEAPSIRWSRAAARAVRLPELRLGRNGGLLPAIDGVPEIGSPAGASRDA